MSPQWGKDKSITKVILQMEKNTNLDGQETQRLFLHRCASHNRTVEPKQLQMHGGTKKDALP